MGPELAVAGVVGGQQALCWEKAEAHRSEGRKHGEVQGNTRESQERKRKRYTEGYRGARGRAEVRC